MITISQLFRPFSVIPGTTCVIPKSLLFAKIYPSLIQIFDSKDNCINEVVLKSFKPPLDKFFIFQDLKRGGVQVFSEQYRYFISPKGEVIEGKGVNNLETEGSFLSLGVHKKQNWLDIFFRKDLKEILPLWHRLGQLIPCNDSFDNMIIGSTQELIEQLVKSLNNRDKKELQELFIKIFLCCFENSFIPKLYDTFHQGILRSVYKEKSPMNMKILTLGSTVIEKLFIDFSDEGNIMILPCLLPCFHSGKMTNIKLGDFGVIDFEWTKKKIKKVIFKSLKNQLINPSFDKSIKQFRSSLFKNKKNSKIVQSGCPIEVESGKLYLWDRFSH